MGGSFCTEVSMIRNIILFIETALQNKKHNGLISSDLNEGQPGFDLNLC